MKDAGAAAQRVPEAKELGRALQAWHDADGEGFGRAAAFFELFVEP